MNDPSLHDSSDRGVPVPAVSNRLRIPVTVVLERRMVSRSFWSLPVWRLHGVLVGEHLSHEPASGPQPVNPLRETDVGEPADLFSWAGFSVTLYRDACERYWHTLIGDKPRVHVICHDVVSTAPAEGGTLPDTDGSGAKPMTLKPVKVTVNYDEAIAYGDTDQQVLSAPMPAELYRHLEAFVVKHYKPQEFKKRKRRNWGEESERRAGRPLRRDPHTGQQPS